MQPHHGAVSNLPGISQRWAHLNHPDLQLPSIRRDEADVQSLVEFMDICWLNLLSQDHSDVVSLSTATVAPPDRAADLFGAHRIGEEAYQAFKQERLEANAATTKFHVKMT